MRGKGKPFVKGDPRAGRPKGAKGKKTVERDRVAFWTAFLSSNKYLDNATQRVLRGRASHVENYWMPRVDGKPVETVELTGANRRPLKVVIEVVRGG